MAAYQIVETICKDPSGKAGEIFLLDNGLRLWEVKLRAGLPEPVRIGHTADLHFNYCDEQDLAEADPVLMSTLKHRTWKANGESVPNARRALAFLHETTDQVVVNGDTLDYLSHGAMELMQREVWDKYPGILATVGGHELAVQMEGTVPETLPRSVLLARLEAFWKHDIYYTSKLVKGKVLIVTVMNDQARFDARQVRRFAADLALAREKGHAVLLFGHEPFPTHDPADRAVPWERNLLRGDKSGFPLDLCDYKNTGDPDTAAFNGLIADNADIIKGVFAGHLHNAMYHEIPGRGARVAEARIPQFIVTANAYVTGFAMRVTVD